MKKFLFILICIIIYCVPIGIVINISNEEELKYVEDTEFEFDITSYGKVEQIQRVDIQEYYEVDMEITAINKHYIEMPSNAKVLCENGDEVAMNQTMAMVGSNEIKSDFDGIITDIEYGEKITVNYYDFDDLVMKTNLPEEKYNILINKKFTDEEGNKIKLIKRSKVLVDGKFNAVFSIPKGKKYMYGKIIEGFKLYTGTEYENVLAVSCTCVYKQGDNSFVRRVDSEGNFIDEVKVETGFSDGDFVCVFGDEIQEGNYCDSGYSSIVNEESTDERD